MPTELRATEDPQAENFDVPTTLLYTQNSVLVFHNQSHSSSYLPGYRLRSVHHLDRHIGFQLSQYRKLDIGSTVVNHNGIF